MKSTSQAKILRLIAGLNQDELALRAGIGRADVSRLERGYHTSPRIRAAVALVFGVPVEALDPDPEEIDRGRRG